MKRLYTLLSLLVITTSLGAKILVPQNVADFNDIISRNPYAIVHYINYANSSDDKLKEQALTSMKAEFAQSANESAHTLAGIAFIGANSRITPDLLASVESNNQLKKGDYNDDFSVIFMYKNGKPVTDSTGYLATLTGAFDQADLGVFIQKYLGDYITYQLQQAEARRIAQPATRTVTRVYEQQPIYRYSEPVYYDDYYYRRPRIGIGLGFGGGWGWGGGWGRRGWGPGFGFGIGF